MSVLLHNITLSTLCKYLGQLYIDRVLPTTTEHETLLVAS